MSDSRAFGYIFGSPDTGHRFFGIKTDKAASQVIFYLPEDNFICKLNIFLGSDSNAWFIPSGIWIKEKRNWTGQAAHRTEK